MNPKAKHLLVEAGNIAYNMKQSNSTRPLWQDEFARISERIDATLEYLKEPPPPEVAGWRGDGSVIFDNTPTVVAVLVTIAGHLLLVRRNTEPGKGKIALPGGFHMRGETWQQAGAREVLEETGVLLPTPSAMNVLDITTDEYGHNVLIAHYTGGDAYHTGDKTDGEADKFTHPFEQPMNPEDWAFLLHYRAVRNHCGW